MDSSSRKRRASDVFATADASPANKPQKGRRISVLQVPLGIPIADAHPAVPVTDASLSTRPLAMPAPLPSQRENDQARFVTPQNSFHEGSRRVSVLSLGEVEVLANESDDESIHSATPSTSNTTLAAAAMAVVTDVVTRVSPVQQGEPGHTAPMNTFSLPKDDVSQASIPAEPAALRIAKQNGGKNHRRPLGFLAVVAVTLAFVGTCFLSTPVVLIDDPNALYVPGGGFSGFWYTLGRLNSIQDPLEKKYYCYSAGCLGVATMLSNVTMEDAYGYAVGAQKQWQRGELSRYDVTESFVNDLLYENAAQGTLRPAFTDNRVLSTLRIITSERDASRLGLRAAVRTPGNAKELKEMLLQTAWIPFALSRDLWHGKHMDGAFTLHEHPRCLTNLGYDGLEWDLMLNALNVNLPYQKVQAFWRKGLLLGLGQ